MTINFKKSLSTRIVNYVLFFCFILFLVSISIIYIFAKKTIKETTLTNAQSITQNTEHKSGEVLISIEKIVLNYKWLLEKKQINCDSIFEITKLIVEANEEIIGCAIAFEPNIFPEHGRYFAPASYRDSNSIKTTQLGNVDYEYSVMDWYQIPIAIAKPYWTEPYYDNGGTEALITSFSIPFYRTINKERKIAGVIKVDLSLAWLTKIVSSVSILETGYASLITRNGMFVTHPNKELIMNQTIFSYAREKKNTALKELGKMMQTGKTGNMIITFDGIKKMIFYTPITSSHWSLMVSFPVDEMYSPLEKFTKKLILIIIIGLFLLSLIVWRVVSTQIKPLSLFAKSAKEIARGDFNCKLPEIKTKDEMYHLRKSFAYMQTELSQYILFLEFATASKEKIESELRIAREIQMGMIPKIFPPFPNVTEIDLFAMLEPAKEVGGDLYDFFMIDKQHLCFAIGDVSGKGVPASLFMAVTRTLLRSLSPNEHSPANIVNGLNCSLSKGNDSSMFVTFFIGIINLSTGTVTYCNAGHNPPVYIKPDGVTEFLPIQKSIPVGIYEEYEYQESVLQMSPHDKLFLYTDGITEAENIKQELYSDNRLLQCINNHILEHPKELIQYIAEDVSAHVKENVQSDDITMLSIIYNGK